MRASERAEGKTLVQRIEDVQTCAMQAGWVPHTSSFSKTTSSALGRPYSRHR